MTHDDDSPVVLRVRDGDLLAESWLYVWLAVPAGSVLYVGGTRLPPQARVWLHLHDADPDVALAARHPEVLDGPVDVLAFPLPDHVVRATAKAALITALHEARLLSPGYVGDPPGAAPGDGATADAVAPIVAEVVARAAAR